MVPEPVRGRVAALDLGEVRTGIALSDPDGIIASPLDVVPSEEVAHHLGRLIREEGVSEVVVGVPRTLRGEVGFQARRVLATLDALRDEFPGARFVEWDERLTTRVAADGAGSRKKGGKKGRTSGRVDHLAAAGMLQEYLGRRGNV